MKFDMKLKVTELKRPMLNRKLSGMLSDNQLDEINTKIKSIGASQEEQEQIINSFVSFPSILENSSYSIQSYLNAVMFITMLSVGNTVIDSYRIVFPERFQKMVDEGRDRKTIQAYASAYNSTKLVNLLKKQVLIPFYILNQHTRQDALNKMQHLMYEGKTDFIQLKAAECILNVLETPKELDLNVNTTTTLSDDAKELKLMLDQVVNATMNAVDEGVDSKVFLKPIDAV